MSLYKCFKVPHQTDFTQTHNLFGNRKIRIKTNFSTLKMELIQFVEHAE